MDGFNWSILGWIAGLVFVYVFGLFEGRGQGYKRRKAEEEKEQKQQTPPAAKPETITVDDPGLLRIKDENGSFVLDLDGKRLNPLALSSSQRKRLIDMLNIMRPWLDARSAASSSRPTAPPFPAVQPTTLNDRLNALGDAPPEESKRVTPPPAAPPPLQPAPPLAARSSTIAKEDRPAAPANSIVSQIDTILQSRLSGTPLEGRGIFLTQSLEGGVNVYVGLSRYSGIDEVPDPQIKAAIRAAISEWENKYTPGL